MRKKKKENYEILTFVRMTKWMIIFWIWRFRIRFFCWIIIVLLSWYKRTKRSRLQSELLFLFLTQEKKQKNMHLKRITEISFRYVMKNKLIPISSGFEQNFSINTSLHSISVRNSFKVQKRNAMYEKSWLDVWTLWFLYRARIPISKRPSVHNCEFSLFS